MPPVTVTPHDRAVAALEPFGTLPDWLAAVMRPERLEESLRRHATGLGDGGPALVSAETDQLRAKGERWLVRVLVTLAWPDRDEHSEVALVGELHPPHLPGRADDGAVVASEGEPARPGEPGWRVRLPDLRLELTAEESDGALPSLGDLVDPDASARLIEGMLHDAGYPSARVATTVPTVARYKPGSRCTIVYDVTYDPPSAALPNPVIAKTHQGEKGVRSHEAMTALWATALSSGDAAVIAEPLGYLVDGHIQLQGPVPEDRILKDLAHEAFQTEDPVLLDDLRLHLRATALALAALHTSGAELGATVGFGDEVADARSLVDELARTVPDLARWAEPTLTLLEAADRRIPADPQVSSHNSFSPAQVLLGPGAPAIIDFDSAAMGEPAMDVGRFRAGLRCVGVPALAKGPGGYREDRVRARLDLLDDLCDAFLDAYRSRAPVTSERVALWESLDLFTSLLHTWTKGRIEKVTPRLATLRHSLGNPLLPS
ncbi:phosphotransferase [Nostocoides sp. F2B08]|uniref:phosphotransferase n=1 Tax=Nostocoides sp. F2B08 TaxID=2653936 RepID=UPI001262F9C0|nr:phosphotransferase [Tetrasphaera sp. F2B08]KAB7746374.1 phosphotransferase [Tetrasphaera sp. F2B08]